MMIELLVIWRLYSKNSFTWRNLGIPYGYWDDKVWEGNLLVLEEIFFPCIVYWDVRTEAGGYSTKSKFQANTRTQIVIARSWGIQEICGKVHYLTIIRPNFSSYCNSCRSIICQILGLLMQNKRGKELGFMGFWEKDRTLGFQTSHAGERSYSMPYTQRFKRT